MDGSEERRGGRGKIRWIRGEKRELEEAEAMEADEVGERDGKRPEVQQIKQDTRK